MSPFRIGVRAVGAHQGLGCRRRLPRGPHSHSVSVFVSFRIRLIRNVFIPYQCSSGRRATRPWLLPPPPSPRRSTKWPLKALYTPYMYCMAPTSILWPTNAFKPETGEQQGLDGRRSRRLPGGPHPPTIISWPLKVLYTPYMYCMGPTCMRRPWPLPKPPSPRRSSWGHTTHVGGI